MIPVIEIRLETKRFSLSLSTPDFRIETEELRPRLIPGVRRDDLGGISEFRWFVFFTWIFHATIAYGKPLTDGEPLATGWHERF